MSTVVCSKSVFTVLPQQAVNGIVPDNTLYSWDPPTYNGLLTGGQSGANAKPITGTLNNLSNTVQTATYVIRTTSGACTGFSFALTVYVNPTPVFSAMSTVVCSGVTLEVSPKDGFIGNIVPPDTRYSWTNPTYSATMTGGDSGTSLQFISGKLFNMTNVVRTATYIVVPKATTGNCEGGSFTLTVFVNPTPVFNAMSTVVCSGVTFEVSPKDGFIGNIVPADTRYSWTNPTYSATMTGGDSGTNLQFISGKLFNMTNVVRTATYIVVPKATTGSCEGGSFTLTVFVNPTPVFNTLTTVTCSGVTFEVSPKVGFDGNIVPADTRYSWEVPSYSGTITGGASASSATFISGKLSNKTNVLQSATYNVTPLALTGSCKGSAFSLIVNVNPTPEITEMSTVTCSGVAFNISPTNPQNGIVPAGTIYSWEIPAVSNASLTGGVSGNSIGQVIGTLVNNTNVLQSATYIINANTANNCIGNSFTAIVYVESKSRITEMSTTVCSGTLFRVTPTNETNGIVPFGTKYKWDPPTVSNVSLTGGQSATTPQSSIFGTLRNGTNIVQTAVYIITPETESCGTSNSFTVTVYVNPKPEITAMTTVDRKSVV
jgi:hypothetical protein